MTPKSPKTCAVRRCYRKAIPEKVPVKAGSEVAEVGLCLSHAYGYHPKVQTGLVIYSHRDGLDDAGKMAERILVSIGWDQPKDYHRTLDLIADELRLGWGADATPAVPNKRRSKA